SQAEALARAAVAQFAKEQQADNEAWAHALLAQALAVQGKRVEAQQSITRAQELAATCQNKIVSLFVRRTAIILRISLEKKASYDDVQRELEVILADAKSNDFVVEELEIKLVRLEMIFKNKHREEDQNAILALVKEAKQRGLLLLAKKANTVVEN